MRLDHAALGVVLLASLAANVYLVARAAPSSPSRPPSPSTSSPSDGAPTTAVVTRLSDPTELASLDDAALAQREVDARARIATLLTLDVKYEKATHSPASEAEAAAHLDRLYALPDGTIEPHPFECRGSVCRIHSGPSTIPRAALQSTAGLIAFHSILFSNGKVFLELTPPDLRPAQIKRVIEMLLDHSDAGDACIAQHPATGHLALRVDFAAASRSFVVTQSGDLATHPVSACLRSVVEAALAPVIVPAGTPPIVFATIEIDLPRDGTNAP